MIDYLILIIPHIAASFEKKSLFVAICPYDTDPAWCSECQPPVMCGDLTFEQCHFDQLVPQSCCNNCSTTFNRPCADIRQPECRIFAARCDNARTVAAIRRCVRACYRFYGTRCCKTCQRYLLIVYSDSLLV